ncbi:hypothetical protein LIA77_02699 [Sarocladium implicatum]|nr:hypothetical protein LIA77_02699 [Sarocladium implicatum]
MLSGVVALFSPPGLARLAIPCPGLGSAGRFAVSLAVDPRSLHCQSPAASSTNPPLLSRLLAFSLSSGLPPSYHFKITDQRLLLSNYLYILIRRRGNCLPTTTKQKSKPRSS